MNEAIRIILVDGREPVRRGLRHMLELEEDIEVVGDYASAEEVFSETVRLRSNIVLISTQLPGMDVIKATHGLKRNGLNYGGDVIILADSMDYQTEALAAGAVGYLLQNATWTELVQSIRVVYRNSHLVTEFEKEGDGPAEEMVELVVPPPGNATWLLRFICQLGEIVREDSASIASMVGSWDRGTIITIRLQSAILASFLIELANMPEVEEVGGKVEEGGLFATLPRKTGLLPRSDVTPRKRVCVTLQEADMVSRGTRS